MKTLTKAQLNRFPDYLNLLLKLKKEGVLEVSSKDIANNLNLNIEKVRKDIAAISSIKGKPNSRRDVNILIEDIEKNLGYKKNNKAVIMGIGNLGKALIKFDGFKEYGLEIVAGFDNNPMLNNLIINNKKIYNLFKLDEIIKENDIKIGIITVPQDSANEIASLLVKSGIEAIWNFSPVKLEVPKSIIVSNMNMAQSLAVLSHKLYIKNKEK